MAKSKVAIIGGSGLEKLEIFKNAKLLNPETPYGKCSAPVLFGETETKEVYVFSRHGFQHQFSPTEVNNRAHIWAIKDLGCNAIIATTACGSLREEIEPGDLVFPDQVIDFTKFRKNTFFDSFEKGMNHVAFGDPFSSLLIQKLKYLSDQMQLKSHSQKTVITIEGPRFSSRAESYMFRAWGADIINMSTAPEVALANEMKIPYAAIAMSTDYDCWRENEEAVSQEAVFEVFKQNANKVTNLLKAYLENAE
jgi:5'-methylthioadenosine phosphorylase